MNRQSFRQGDVLVRATTKQPSTRAKRVTDHGRTILAYGEVTGHAHEVVDDVARRVENVDAVPAMQLFEEPGGTRLLVISRPVSLTHQEHGRIGLPVGTFEVIRQREYSPEAIRTVAD